MDSLGEDATDRVEESGGFVEVALALLKIEFDVSVDSIAAQVLQEFGEGVIVAMGESVGKKDRTRILPMVMRELLDLSESLSLQLGLKDAQGGKSLLFAFAVFVVMEVTVHATADRGTVGGDTDGGGDEFVAQTDE